MEATVVVRNRYQITIPESIRESFAWLIPGAVMKLISANNRLILQPYQAGAVGWDEVWNTLDAVFQKGKKTSLADFVISDRLSRR